MDGKSSSRNGSAAEGVRAVERAIEILQAFSPARPSMSVMELQQVLGLSRPTLYRLLQTLAAKSLARVEGEPQRFSLGPGIASLAHVWTSCFDATKLARPILERLRDQTDETAALFVLRDDKRLCVLELISRQPLAISRGLGETEHISRGASGKAMLAFLEEGHGSAASIWKTLPAGVDEQSLREDLARTRRIGFAVSRGERFVGAVAIAAPFFDCAGRVAGSIGLFGPETRLGPGRLQRTASLVVEAAGRLSAELGYAPRVGIVAGRGEEKVASRAARPASGGGRARRQRMPEAD